MSVKNTRQALEILLELFKRRGFTVTKTTPMHFQRHYSIKAFHHDLGIVRFYMIFQRKPFMKFAEYFGAKGGAVTINKNILNYLVEKKIDRLIYVLGDGKIYMISPKFFAYKAEKEGWVRRTEKTGEEVCHLPLDLLTKVI